MSRLRHVFLSLVVLTVLAAAANAQEPIRFARTPGHLARRQARRLQLPRRHLDRRNHRRRRPARHHARGPRHQPRLQPRRPACIAFSSNRHGSYDVFVVPVQRRQADAADLRLGQRHASPAGRPTARASCSPRRAAPTSRQPTSCTPSRSRAAGSAASAAAEGKEGVFSPEGRPHRLRPRPGHWYRKGYRGSSNDDIWVCNADGTNNRRLTTFNGQDNSPMWSRRRPARSTTSASTSARRQHRQAARRLARRPDQGRRSRRQLTFHKDDGVRRARISGNGEWIVYECGADLWVVSHQATARTPRKLAIEVHADDKSNTERDRHLHPAAPPSSPSPPTRSTSPSPSTASCSCMPVAGSGKADAADRRPGLRPRHRLVARRQEDHLRLRPRRPRRPLPARSRRPGAPEVHRGAPASRSTQLTNTPRGRSPASASRPTASASPSSAAGKLWTMNPDGTRPEGRSSTTCRSSTTSGRPTASGSSTPAATARSPASCTSSPPTAPRRRTGTQRHPLRHLQRRRDLERERQEARLPQRARAAAAAACTSCRCRSRPPPAPPAERATSTGTTSTCASSSRPPMPVEEGGHLARRHQGRLPLAGQNGDDLWVASTTAGQLTRADHRQPAARSRSAGRGKQLGGTSTSTSSTATASCASARVGAGRLVQPAPARRPTRRRSRSR